jgi:hypothetical protein
MVGIGLKKWYPGSASKLSKSGEAVFEKNSALPVIGPLRLLSTKNFFFSFLLSFLFLTFCCCSNHHHSIERLSLLHFVSKESS